MEWRNRLGDQNVNQVHTFAYLMQLYDIYGKPWACVFRMVNETFYESIIYDSQSPRVRWADPDVARNAIVQQLMLQILTE